MSNYKDDKMRKAAALYLFLKVNEIFLAKFTGFQVNGLRNVRHRSWPFHKGGEMYPKYKFSFTLIAARWCGPSRKNNCELC